MPDSTDPFDRASAPAFARAIDAAVANGAQMVVGGVTTADGATEVHAAGLRTPDPAEPATADTIIATMREELTGLYTLNKELRERLAKYEPAEQFPWGV